MLRTGDTLGIIIIIIIARLSKSELTSIKIHRRWRGVPEAATTMKLKGFYTACQLLVARMTDADRGPNPLPLASGVPGRMLTLFLAPYLEMPLLPIPKG